MSEKRKPWAKWYWGDWRKDARLRRCSYAARGLWADMLSLMGGETDHIGCLVMEGQALDASDLAGLLGGGEREVAKMLGELERKRVFNRVSDTDIPEDIKPLIPSGLPAPTIISRRMLRDKARDQRDKEIGSRGGNPNLAQKPDDGITQHSLDGLTPPDNAQRLEARDQRLEEESSPASRAPPSDAQAAVAAWNAMAERAGLAKVQRLTQARATQLAARMREAGGLPGIESALAIVERSAFLTGRRPGGAGHEGWRCTFDFFLKQQSFTKIMEGQYDDREGAGAGAAILGGRARGNGIAAAAAELERRLEERDRRQPQPEADR